MAPLTHPPTEGASMKASLLFMACGLAVISVASHAAQAAWQPNYALTDRFPAGGPGGWDLLNIDPVARRVYVSRSDRVLVLDADKGTPVGEIAGTDGVHGIALAPDLGLGYTSNGRSNSVTVFKLDTLETVDTVAIEGKFPDAILYDASSKRVLVFNGRSSDVTVLDAASHKPVATIALDGKPELAASDGRGRVFVNIEDKSELSAIDPVAGKVVANWPLKNCKEPTGLAIDRAHHRLFSACQGHVMVVTDADDGHKVAEVPIGDGPDGAEFDPGYGMVFSSNGSDGTLTVVHEDGPDKYRVVANVATQRSARTVVLDPVTHRLLLPAAEYEPPAPGAEPGTRPKMKADTFVILVVAALAH
jgi:YVTN family beta-propeller protein